MYEKQSSHGQEYILRSDSQVQAITARGGTAYVWIHVNHLLKHIEL